MENKKLIKSIKKQVSKKFKLELEESILKEFLKGASKKQIKKIKKKILLDLQKDFFGKSKKYKTDLSKDLTTDFTSEIESNPTIEITHSDLKEEQTDLVENNIFEYAGFKFDVDRMSQIVTGKKKPGASSDGENVSRVNKNKTKDFPPNSPSYLKVPNTELDFLAKIASSSNSYNLKESGEFTLPDGISINRGLMRPPSSKNMAPHPDGIMTPSSKEELSFFLDKLKSGISKLGKGEKMINYRHSKGDVYLFTFSRDKNPEDKNDFTLTFSIELNIKTSAAIVKYFTFNIEKFKFDSSFFELIDIVRVLDLVGMNISYYINEINELNSEEKSYSTPSNEQFSIGLFSEIESFIDDKKIVSLLKDNDITTYGRLIEIDDLTTLKGIGSKTSEKIKSYINLKASR